MKIVALFVVLCVLSQAWNACVSFVTNKSFQPWFSQLAVRFSSLNYIDNGILIFSFVLFWLPFIIGQIRKRF